MEAIDAHPLPLPVADKFLIGSHGLTMLFACAQIRRLGGKA
jgi:hypothetical protein